MQRFILHSMFCLSVVSSEMRLHDLCWIPFDVRDKTFGAYGGRFDLETHSSLPASGIIDEDHVILEFPPNAVDPGTTVHVRYTIIVDGPFRVPTGYRFGSMVVYLVVNGTRLKIPMILHLPHWLTCVSSNRSLVKCLRASHSLDTGEDSYSFSLLDEGTYNISDTASTIQVDGNNCLFAVAHKEGIKERYQYQKFEKESLEKQEKEVCVYITFFTLTWLQVSLCVVQVGWNLILCHNIIVSADHVCKCIPVQCTCNVHPCAEAFHYKYTHTVTHTHACMHACTHTHTQ